MYYVRKQSNSGRTEDKGELLALCKSYKDASELIEKSGRTDLYIATA